MNSTQHIKKRGIHITPSDMDSKCTHTDTKIDTNIDNLKYKSTDSLPPMSSKCLIFFPNTPCEPDNSSDFIKSDNHLPKTFSHQDEDSYLIKITPSPVPNSNNFYSIWIIKYYISYLTLYELLNKTVKKRHYPRSQKNYNHMNISLQDVTNIGEDLPIYLKGILFHTTFENILLPQMLIIIRITGIRKSSQPWYISYFRY